MKHRPKHVIEYVLLATFVGVLRFTPHRLAMLQGVILAGAIHYMGGFRRQEARRRIRQILGESLSEREVNRIAWISFRNLALNAIEVIRAPRLNKRWEQQHMECSQLSERLKSFTDKKQGVIIALVHAGNWDITGVVADRQNIPAAYIARTQKNPLTNAFLNNMRGLHGAETIDRDDARFLPKVLKSLKQGRALAILIDLRSKTKVPEAEFLDHPANLSAGMVMIAQHAEVPIVPATLLRKGWFSHEFKALETLYTQPDKNKKAERQEVLQSVLDQFTVFIKQHPEQYFWYNKRWVLDPFEQPEDAKAAVNQSDTNSQA